MNQELFSKLQKEYNDKLKKSQSKAIFTRAIEQQKDEISNIDDLLLKLYEFKKSVILEQDEINANLILCLELAAEAIKSELHMIINLKEGKMSLAWDCLVASQAAIIMSIKNNPISGDYLIGYANKLHMYEQILFPSMVFSSAGFIVSKSICSICNENYIDCEHIKGQAYLGKLCQQKILEISELEEVSFVENPVDKRCRIVSYQENGKNYDALTHRLIIN
jgi:hypothetical protein